MGAALLACGGGPGSANDSTGLAAQNGRWDPRSMQDASGARVRSLAAPRGALAAVAAPCPAPLPKTLPGSPTAVDRLNAAKLDSLIRFACAAVVVTPPPAPPPSPPVVAGRTVRVPAGSDLAAAVLAAQPGDVLVLDSAATYTANVVLGVLSRAAGDTGWVTIRTSGTLPPPGVRVSDTLAAKLGFPKILTPNAGPAVATAPGAQRWLLQGVWVGAAPNVMVVNTLVAFGDGSPAQNTLASVPHHLILDRSVVLGTPTLDLRRCVALNSGSTAILDSDLRGCHSKNGDSQAAWGSNGPGPFVIENTRLEGWGENVMFGGDDARLDALVPADITIRGNWIVTPRIMGWGRKNVLELKSARRVLIEGNVLEGSWAEAQTGYCVIFKSVNQGGPAPWGSTADVTMRRNVLANCENGITVAGRPEAQPLDSTTRRVTITQNWYTDIPAGKGSRWLLVGDGVDDLTVDHNTSDSDASPGVIFSCCVQARFHFTNNDLRGTGTLVAPERTDILHGVAVNSGEGYGNDALAAHASDGVVTGNRFPGAYPKSVPTMNGAPAPDVGADTVALKLMADSVRRGVRRVP